MKKILLTILFATTVLGGGILVPEKAHAQFAVVEVGPNVVTNTITTAKTVLDSVKEYVLDGIAWQIANIALEQMTQDIVTWINSGFNGSPAFIQNPGRFFVDIADNIAGNFLQELGGGFLCEALSADIRFSLEVGYYQAGGNSSLADRYSCTLSDAIGNVEKFLENDLSQGGLDQFFNVTARPQNNPYLLALDLRQELDGRIFGQLEGERQLLEWNGGFLSKRECLNGEQEPNCTGDVLTPGDTIQNQLNDSLGIGRDRLLVADDINEIIGALMNQLVSQALGGAQGLIGTSRSNGGGSSYFDSTNNPGVSEEDRSTLENTIESGIRSGTTAERTLERVVSDAARASSFYSTGLSQGTCTSANLARLQSISQEASGHRTEALSLRSTIESGVRTLQRLLGDLLQSNSRSEYLVIAQQYQSLLGAGDVPTEASPIQASLLQTQANALIAEAEDILNNCST